MKLITYIVMAITLTVSNVLIFGLMVDDLLIQNIESAVVGFIIGFTFTKSYMNSKPWSEK